MRIFKPLWPALICLVLTSPGQAHQPNPYKFPVARGVNIPISEGYWATSKDICGRLQLGNQKRPHVGLKGLPIENNEAFSAYSFRYLGPRLGNWPDGLCFVHSIRRETKVKFAASGICGIRGDNERFSAVILVHSSHHVSVTLDGTGGIQDGKSDYYFCKSVLSPRGRTRSYQK